MKLPVSPQIQKIKKNLYIVAKDMDFIYNNTIYRVDEGFITDYASVPKMLQFLFSKDSIHSLSSILHDWLYNQQKIRRKDADNLLYVFMELEHSKKTTRLMFYYGVRAFGWIYWNKIKRGKKNDK